MVFYWCGFFSGQAWEGFLCHLQTFKSPCPTDIKMLLFWVSWIHVVLNSAQVYWAKWDALGYKQVSHCSHYVLNQSQKCSDFSQCGIVIGGHDTTFLPELIFSFLSRMEILTSFPSFGGKLPGCPKKKPFFYVFILSLS